MKLKRLNIYTILGFLTGVTLTFSIKEISIDPTKEILPSTKLMSAFSPELGIDHQIKEIDYQDFQGLREAHYKRTKDGDFIVIDDYTYILSLDVVGVVNANNNFVSDDMMYKFLNKNLTIKAKQNVDGSYKMMVYKIQSKKLEHEKVLMIN